MGSLDDQAASINRRGLEGLVTTPLASDPRCNSEVGAQRQLTKLVGIEKENEPMTLTSVVQVLEKRTGEDVSIVHMPSGVAVIVTPTRTLSMAFDLHMALGNALRVTGGTDVTSAE